MNVKKKKERLKSLNIRSNKVVPSNKAVPSNKEENLEDPNKFPVLNERVVKKSGPDARSIRRFLHINIDKPQGKKAWERLVRSNQVFDTTNFGDRGGYWVNDRRGIPRFIKQRK